MLWRGHLAKSCRSKSAGKINKGTEPVKRENKQPGHRDNKNKDKKKAQPTHLVEETCEEDDVYAETMYHIRGGNKQKAYEISIELCNAPHNFEIDTGATRSIISKETYNQLRNKVELKSSKAVLSTYTGERISVAGEVVVPVKYQDQQYCCSTVAGNCSKRSWSQSSGKGLAPSSEAQLAKYFQDPRREPSAPEHPRCTWRFFQ